MIWKNLDCSSSENNRRPSLRKPQIFQESLVTPPPLFALCTYVGSRSTLNGPFHAYVVGGLD